MTRVRSRGRGRRTSSSSATTAMRRSTSAAGRLVQCAVDGFREQETLLTIQRGTATRPGRGMARRARGHGCRGDRPTPGSATPFDLLGTGVWVEDDEGVASTASACTTRTRWTCRTSGSSPCTKGISLTTFQPDRLRGETYQRSRFTGSDAADFVVGGGHARRRSTAPSGPSPRRWPRARSPGWRRRCIARRRTPACASPRTRSTAPPSGRLTSVVSVRRRAGQRSSWRRRAAPPRAVRWSSIAACRDGLDPIRPDVGRARGIRRCLRIPVRAPRARAAPDADGATVSWTGRGAAVPSSCSRSGIRQAGQWRRLDARSGDRRRVRSPWPGACAQPEVVERQDRTARAERATTKRGTAATAADGAFEDPADYDLAISHITDTQYLTEAYPEVYARGRRLDRRECRAAQDRVRHPHGRPRAELGRPRPERATAPGASSSVASHDAGACSTTPASRTACCPATTTTSAARRTTSSTSTSAPTATRARAWYGGSIAPGDNSANFSTFEHEGARFLMLSLPYAYGERETRLGGSGRRGASGPQRRSSRPTST